jgi:hypothetical protein
LKAVVMMVVTMVVM